MNLNPTSIRRALSGVALAALAAVSSGAQAADFTLDGSMAVHNDVMLISFTLAAPGTVQLWTDSWQGGVNFDPLLSLFSASGALLASNDDNNSFSASQGYYDSGLQMALGAGSYQLTLSAAPNEALGATLAEGFTYTLDAPIALADWTQPSSDINLGDQKGGHWSVTLQGVDSAVTVVPEPAPGALLLAGLVGLGFLARRRTPR